MSNKMSFLANRNVWKLLLPVFAIFVITGCNSVFKDAKGKANTELTLGISAYSYKADKIDTKIFIDGKEYFNEEIITPIKIAPQVKQLKMMLPKGKHKIRVENLNKTSVFEKDFELTKDKMWGQLEFTRKNESKNEKNSYIFNISPEPIGYL